MVQREPHAQSEFGVVFEERVTPRRTAALNILSVGSGRQVAAVDAGTTGGIRDYGAVAKELSQQFDIRSFPTTRAGARELNNGCNNCTFLTELNAIRPFLYKSGSFKK